MGSPIGKVPADLLRELLEKYALADPRVVVGPGIREDAAIIDTGDRVLVAKTDPVTIATDEIGWYAVHGNDAGCTLWSTAGRQQSLPVFVRDEITRLFDRAE